MFTLAIVGRPNVGKSTLFNRLAGKKLAIVDDTPGVTRDWRTAEGNLFGRPMTIIDTAGLEESFDDSIQGRMRKQTEAGVKQADAILFVIDGRQGLTAMDKHFAEWLRRQKKPVILAVNKCEHSKSAASGLAEAHALGLGEPVPISAEHGDGMELLYEMLTPYFPEEIETENGEDNEGDNFAALDEIEGKEDFEFEQEEEDPETPLKIAIVGRPNVGKSTLLNSIVNDQRVMTGPEAGITRDAIAVDWNYNGRAFKLVDTAGMRKKARVQNNIEKMSVEDSMRAIRLAQVVILVVDAADAFEKQDVQIAAHVIEEGRALVVAINKWDAVDDRKKLLEEIKYGLQAQLAQVKDLPLVTISALNNNNIDGLLETVLKTYETWNKRIRTAGLNRWLRAKESQNPAPLANGRANRLKYITQIKTRPPTFAIWVSKPDALPQTHKRYLINSLRDDYDIPGVPVRLLIRASKNPYTDE
ncbi:MAG: ribosome biogenesis GTPase Der [Alphaproteobacteria bacterium]